MLLGVLFAGLFATISVIMYGSYPPSPYPVKHYRALCHLATLKVGFSAVSESKRFLI